MPSAIAGGVLYPALLIFHTIIQVAFSILLIVGALKVRALFEVARTCVDQKATMKKKTYDAHCPETRSYHVYETLIILK